MATSLPFGDLFDDDFVYAVGATSHLPRMLIDCELRLNLNPYETLEDGLIDNDDIDADKNYFNTDSNIINDYCDSVQLDNLLSPIKTGSLSSLMHVNARSLVANGDKLCLNLATLRHKFSIVAVTETWLSPSTEGCFAVYLDMIK